MWLTAEFGRRLPYRVASVARKGHSTVRAAGRRVWPVDRRRLLADARDEVAAAHDQTGSPPSRTSMRRAAREQHLVARRDALHLVAEREHDAGLHGHLADATG